MKTLAILTLFASTTLMAQTWTETFKLPEGMTHRARTAGYDCGIFTSKYVSAPETFKSRSIEFKQLAADKDLNKFLFEAVYPGTEGQQCIYGIYLDRNRATKTLDFTHSLVVTAEGMEEGCKETQSFLDTELASVAYEPSKRGIRYIAVQIIKDTPNDVCENGNVRVVFDRRYTE
ncbi:hypothetical protein [Peredibacter starrii]|uniref:Uncharacterized protein n=1 Tax=Peredibacter starrii TaxID=28202 RepID=A0AAX4HNG2_9BACT|nr:hypothetical protein [Peredibacter starrii]WPU64730.1 hypothetical protein SOO65_18720 [Peredibacter starrii]